MASSEAINGCENRSSGVLSTAVVIATAFRDQPLITTLEHLEAQKRQPERVIIADGAPAPGVESLITDWTARHTLNVVYHRCHSLGAASQRNEAAEKVTEDVILFMDDDLYAEPDCLGRMLDVLERDDKTTIGGVGVLLTNQHSRPPSRAFKRWLDFLADEKRDSYAGCVIGPAVNIFPEPTEDGSVIAVEWLNSTCTAYRRAAFQPVRFASHFTGYSFMEDVHLSLCIGKEWKLVVDTGAKAFHDSQPGQHKAAFKVGRMGVVNRYFVMVDVLGHRSLSHHFRFALLHLVSILLGLRGVRDLGAFRRWVEHCLGVVLGLADVFVRLQSRLRRPAS